LVLDESHIARPSIGYPSDPTLDRRRLASSARHWLVFGAGSGILRASKFEGTPGSVTSLFNVPQSNTEVVIRRSNITDLTFSSHSVVAIVNTRRTITGGIACVSDRCVSADLESHDACCSQLEMCADGLTPVVRGDCGTQPTGQRYECCMTAGMPIVPMIRPLGCSLSIAGEQLCDPRAKCTDAPNGGLQCSCEQNGFRTKQGHAPDGQFCEQDTVVRMDFTANASIIRLAKPGSSAPIRISALSEGERTLGVRYFVQLTHRRLGSVLSSHLSSGPQASAIEWHGVRLSWLSVGPSAFALTPGGNAFKKELAFTVALDCGSLRAGGDADASTCVSDGDEIDALLSMVSDSAPAQSVKLTVQAEATPSCKNSRVTFEAANETGTYVHLFGFDPSEITLGTMRYVVVLYPADADGLPIWRSSLSSQMSLLWRDTPVPFQMDSAANKFSAEIPLSIRNVPGSYPLVVQLNRGLSACQVFRGVVRVANVSASGAKVSVSGTSDATDSTIQTIVEISNGISPVSLGVGIVGAAVLSCMGTVLALYCCRRVGAFGAGGLLSGQHSNKGTNRVQPAKLSALQAGQGEGEPQSEGPHIVIDQRSGMHITAHSTLSKDTDFLKGTAADSCARALEARKLSEEGNGADRDTAVAVGSPYLQASAHSVDLDNVLLSGLPMESPESRPESRHLNPLTGTESPESTHGGLPLLQPTAGNPYDFSAIPLDASTLSSNNDDSDSVSSPGSGNFAARTFSSAADRYLAPKPSRPQPPA
jgi:hypothetical protein